MQCAASGQLSTPPRSGKEWSSYKPRDREFPKEPETAQELFARQYH